MGNAKEKPIAIDEDRIQSLEAHITLINRDLNKLIGMVSRLMDEGEALMDYKDRVALCATNMAKQVEPAVAKSIKAESAERVSKYSRLKRTYRPKQ